MNYDDKRDLQTWLFTIAAHKVTDQLRKMGRRPVTTGSESRRGDDGPDRRTSGSGRRRASPAAPSAARRRRSRSGQSLRDLVREFQAKGE